MSRKNLGCRSVISLVCSPLMFSNRFLGSIHTRINADKQIKLELKGEGVARLHTYTNANEHTHTPHTTGI